LSKSHEHLPSFPSLLAVLGHLEAAGYRISKSKIYRDKDKNFIGVQPDGTVLETEVRAYAATLDRLDGTIDDLSDVHRRKANREVQLQEIKIQKMQLELDKERGKYIPRDEFESELAARAVIFDNGFRHFFQTRVATWIAMVNGQPEKQADLLADLIDGLNEQLTRYATTQTFQVMFLKED